MATYVEATQWMDDNAPFFLTLVLNMGSPVLSHSVDTLAVRSPRGDTAAFQLMMNPTFFEDMTAQELAGVLGHEALHIVLDHLSEAVDPIYGREDLLEIAHEMIVNDRLSNEGFLLPHTPYYGPELLGIDTSPYTTSEVYQFLIDKVNPPQEEPEDGDDNEEGDDAENSDETASSADGGSDGEESDSDADQDADTDESGSEDGSEDGAEGSDGAEGGAEGSEGGSDGADSDKNGSSASFDGEASCGHSHGSGDSNDLSPDEAAALLAAMLASANAADSSVVETISDTLREELGLDSNQVSKAQVAGQSGSATVEEVANNLGLKLSWAKLLADVNPDLLRKPGKTASKTRASWHAPRRKLAHMSPQVMLPNYVRTGEVDRNAREGNNKPFIVLALDQSGSISARYAQQMLSLARSIPDTLIEVECCTFSTYAVPFDHRADNNTLARGGTNFGAVEEFVREVAAKKHGGRYPSAVVCITDGEASFPSNRRPTNEQLKNNWTWLLLSSSDRVWDSAVPKSTWKQLDDYL